MKFLNFLSLFIGIFLFSQNNENFKIKGIYVEINDFKNDIKISKNKNEFLVVEHNNKIINQTFSKFEFRKIEKAFINVKNNKLNNIYFFELDNNEGFYNFIKKYKSNFGILEYAYEPKLLYQTNDYNLYGGNQNYLNLINVKESWDYSKGNSNFIIGISDDGVLSTHEDLLGRISSNQTYYSSWHGTAVSGIAAANTDNNIGISGIGFNSNILFSYSGMQNLLNLSQNGARVVNASWYNSCNFNQLDQLIIDEIYNNGTVIVVASGNGTTCGNPDAYVYPASYNHVISVSSVGQLETPWYSNGSAYNWRDRVEGKISDPTSRHQTNDMVDIRVPGFAIISTVDPNSFNGSKYSSTWGTSFAAPQVTGGISLMLTANPCLNPDEVETILKLTSVKLDSIQENLSYVNKLGAGRMDIGKATKMAWQMNPSNGGLLKIKNRNFNKWNFILTNSPESISISNQSFIENSNVDFKAKKSILLEKNVFLSPSGKNKQYYYIDPLNTCYNFINTPTTSKSVKDNTESFKNKIDLEIFPNPTKDYLNIKYSNIEEIVIFDSSGKLIFNKSNINSKSFLVNLSKYLHGEYLIIINKKYSRKIIKD